jgi:3alpha(or 20beta)-hydroxysteroid dehydrogenase
MAGRLANKVALITGGARGQGAAEGALFSAEGATVFLTDVRVEEGEKAAAAAGAAFLEHDVTSPSRWREVIDHVVARTGRLDVLVNNAGIFHAASMADTALETWERLVAVNQTSVFLGMQAVAPQMKAQRSGSIVNISSVAGIRGTAICFAYGATKWAVRGMTRSAAQELGPFGIRVNSIHPGIIDTPMLEGHPIAEMTAGFPLQRVAHADEVARLALWLASDENSYATGSEFVIDGGMTA